MGKKIVLIDAIKVILNDLDAAFSEAMPEARVLHIVDEGLMEFEDAAGKHVARRFCSAAIAAEEMGADAIVLTCAHGIPFVETVQKLVDPPVVQITIPMIETAVEKGTTIGLVATEEPIIEPIVALLKNAGRRIDKSVTVRVALCEEAFEARLSGNTEKSDALLCNTIKDLGREVDVIVLAQVSSGRVIPKAEKLTDKPILAPARLAAQRVKTLLGL
jgi:Asp/Glu/hydantoin racemase